MLWVCVRPLCSSGAMDLAATFLARSVGVGFAFVVWFFSFESFDPVPLLCVVEALLPLDGFFRANWTPPPGVI